MKRLLEKLSDYIEHEDVRGLVRYCLILLPFVGGAIFGIVAMVNYITRHKEALILCVIASCMIIPALMGKKAEKPLTSEVSANGNLLFFDRLLTKGLFVVFNDYAKQFQIIPPIRYSDLKDALPSGIDPGKRIAVYRFKIAADGESISPADFHEILNCRIEEQLASGELALGKPTAEFNGKLYPKVFLDECICAGGVWHIAILICDSPMVANYIDAKQQILIQRNARFSSQYEDCDF